MVSSVGHAKQRFAAMLELFRRGNQPAARKKNLGRPINTKGLSGPLPSKTDIVEQYAFHHPIKRRWGSSPRLARASHPQSSHAFRASPTLPLTSDLLAHRLPCP